MASIQSDLLNVDPVHVSTTVGGAAIHSFALRDIGVDVLSDVPDLETVYRTYLGDMCFVGRRRADGSFSHLFLAPEFPNNEFGLRERIVSYYALPIFGSTLELCELKLTDPTVTIVDWDKGVRLVKSIDQNRVSEAAKLVVRRVVQIDALRTSLRPNASFEVMRDAVGPASGARFLMSAFLVGDVA
jgi:hypothetical protein